MPAQGAEPRSPVVGKRKSTRAHVDPELIKQLGAAASRAAPIEAVVMLRASKPAKKGADTTARAKALLGRVATATGLEPHDVHVFPNLDSFVVSADAPFIEGIFDQAEVTSVAANRRPDDDMLLVAKPST